MTAETETPTRKRSKLVFLPLIFFAALAGVFLMQLLSGRDISVVPSALIGEPAPETHLPPLAGANLPGIESSAFAGKVTLVNVWASWCAPCREEHPLLVELAKDKRFAIAGLNYKDRPENAKTFLDGLGNPYSAIGVDETGRTGIEWGVYGVPETFLVGKDGVILFKHVGPLTLDAVRTALLPEIEKALGSN
ncbi:MAG TPA: DsbE family thiol:disulfide interchange protein [Rhizobiaceae bacterium]|nr:DsbE family thiol:disulfide interchange protein [Rhizobiaceae bacterium]